MRLPRFARRGASFSKLAYARQEKLSQDRGVGKRLVVIATMATAMTTTAMAATPVTAAVSATMTTAVEAAAMTSEGGRGDRGAEGDGRGGDGQQLTEGFHD